MKEKVTVMNKILVEVYLPVASRAYDVFIPFKSRMYEVLTLLSKVAAELSEGLDRKSVV